jgi:hypothetical protein
MYNMNALAVHYQILFKLNGMGNSDCFQFLLQKFSERVIPQKRQETFISMLCNLRNTKVEQVAHTEIQRYNFFASISYVLGMKGNKGENFKNVLIILQKLVRPKIHLFQR